MSVDDNVIMVKINNIFWVINVVRGGIELSK